MRSKRNENLKYCNKIRTKIAKGKIGKEKKREGRNSPKLTELKNPSKTKQNEINQDKQRNTEYIY